RIAYVHVRDPSCPAPKVRIVNIIMLIAIDGVPQHLRDFFVCRFPCHRPCNDLWSKQNVKLPFQNCEPECQCPMNRKPLLIKWSCVISIWFPHSPSIRFNAATPYYTSHQGSAK